MCADESIDDGLTPESDVTKRSSSADAPVALTAISWRLADKVSEP